MFSFFKKKKPISVPAWANFFSEKEYAEFISNVEKYFRVDNISFEIENDTIKIDENAFGFDFSILGLVNVAQVCKQDSDRSYREIISEHFNTLKRSGKLSQDFKKIINKFDLIKEHIGVRLYNEDYTAHIGLENVVYKDLAGDIKTVLVFDLPESIETITVEQAKKWEKDFDELFRIGIKNIEDNYQFNVIDEKFNDFKIWFVTDEHFFVPNIVFDLNNRPELIGKYGALIGLPTRHTAIIYPIDTMAIINVVNQLIPLIHNMFKDGPGSISEQFFWYIDDEMINLPYEIETDKIQFYPPERFLNILDGLSD